MLRSSKPARIDGMNIDGKIAESVTAPGVLYQIVENDPTNQFFAETIEAQSENWRSEGGITPTERAARDGVAVVPSVTF